MGERKRSRIERGMEGARVQNEMKRNEKIS